MMDKNVPKLAESLVPPAKSDGDDDKKRELGEMVVHRKSNAESSIQNDSKDNLKLPSSNSDCIRD